MTATSEEQLRLYYTYAIPVCIDNLDTATLASVPRK